MGGEYRCRLAHKQSTSETPAHACLAARADVIAGAGLDEDQQPGAMLERGLLDLFALSHREGREFTGGAGDDNSIGALFLVVDQHVLVEAFVELEALVARSWRSDVVQRLRCRRG